ncbi:heterokaryon incompatibility protein-domain-containing protein [Aspergillus avenaceus]|uniref:Heterokaryon incompatibility protein-domain-containing protein n=1 Tax=Aspergillus avenaceus TaxID=36643 RepID=A0A5N6U3L5_ASPAV|nr:heterokaryon incompatibility protein-domain-containing protein [Aspergillus avenaceus]
MRLIHTTRLVLEEFIGNPPPYAILSHRWGEAEISFQEFTRNDWHDAKGAGKIKSFCAKARDAGLEYGWVDTCCINKDSSAELSEAINSMFQWYKNSAICYAYLYDVAFDKDGFVSYTVIKDSEWFRRGWTLQELIAPANVNFLACNWDNIANKHDSRLCNALCEVTNIDRSVLRGEMPLSAFSIAQRMSWASGRRTTRVEDMAYCLLGIFDVNMPLLYGEGEKAFIRLQEEIMKDSADQTIFAWERPEESAHGQPHDNPVTVTNRGVRFNSPRYTELHNRNILVLECQDTNGSSGSVVGIGLERRPGGHNQFLRSRPTLFRNIPLKEFRGVANETSYVMKSFVGKESGTTFYENSIYQQLDPAKAAQKNVLVFFDVVNLEQEMDSNIGKIRRMVKDTGLPFCAFYARTNTIGRHEFGDFISESYNAWEVYDRWSNLRADSSSSDLWKEREAYFAMKDFRVEFCQPVGRVKFLGLFDAVYPLLGPGDSEGERFIRDVSKHWGSIENIRHAVSIDEPQAALRPILINNELSDKGERQSPVIKEMWFVGGHGVSTYHTE